MARVLVIDDDRLFVKLMVHALERRGHEVAFAHDGDAGLRIFEGAHYDAVVCDIVMPEKEGVETIRLLRGARADVGIVAVSGGLNVGGGADIDVLSFVRKLGADITLKKPFQMTTLCEAVDMAIGRRAKAAEAARA
jgi:DNA-binding response OmpR family regulator